MSFLLVTQVTICVLVCSIARSKKQNSYYNKHIILWGSQRNEEILISKIIWLYRTLVKTASMWTPLFLSLWNDACMPLEERQDFCNIYSISHESEKVGWGLILSLLRWGYRTYFSQSKFKWHVGNCYIITSNIFALWISLEGSI